MRIESKERRRKKEKLVYSVSRMMTVLYEHTALRAGAFNVQHLRFYRGKELFVSEPHHVNPDLRSNTN